jgi:hypothetical protein
MTTSGPYNFFEDTPFQATGAADETPNINDVFAYDPSGSPLTDLSGIEFGMQYLDLPDARSGPIDAINFLGSGGEILFSVPVTGTCSPACSEPLAARNCFGDRVSRSSSAAFDACIIHQLGDRLDNRLETAKRMR